MQIEFTNPKFMRKSSKFDKFPKHDFPEIAIIGKSNVGKSSFINHFLKSPGLALTSSTPGRTQEFFFYNVHDKAVFVDLPGYGYASVSKSIKKVWAITMREYLRTREPLKLVLFLLDIRRIPDNNDLDMFDIIMEKELPMILLFTKIDKASASEKQKNKKKIMDVLDLQKCVSVMYSSHENIGRPELSKYINAAFTEEKEEEVKSEE
jgi:GTP-binding protein